MSDSNYALLTGSTVTAVEVWATNPGAPWIAVPTSVGIGYTTPDSGVTWVPPVPTQTVLNQQTIFANVQTRQAAIQAFIAANPSGATLTAAQTLVVAEMLNGLCNILLQTFGSTTGT